MNWDPERLRGIARGLLLFICLVIAVFLAGSPFKPMVETLDQSDVAAAFFKTPEPPYGASAELSLLHRKAREFCGRAHASALSQVAADLLAERILSLIKLRGTLTAADLNDLLGKPLGQGVDPNAVHCLELLILYQFHFPEHWSWFAASSDKDSLDAAIAALSERLQVSSSP